MHTPNASPIFSPDTASRFLQLGATYEALIEPPSARPHGITWEQAEQEGHSHKLARYGFNHFLHVVANNLADRLGRPHISATRDLSSPLEGRRFILGALDNGAMSKHSGDPDMPWLTYQNIDATYKDNPEPSKFADWLHFGAVKDARGTVRDSNIAATLRLYLNPRPEHGRGDRSTL